MGGGSRSLWIVRTLSHHTLNRFRSIHTLPGSPKSLKISPKSLRISPRIVPRYLSNGIPVSEFERVYGMDFKHWLITVEDPDPVMTRDQIIDMYVKMMASVVGSEQEARMKIYSVSTKYYYAFGALISKELSSKFKGMPKVVTVMPDCYKNPKDKDYGGEPFIGGQPVPYDPKYHASNIEAENHSLGIGVDVEEEEEEEEEEMVEINDTDAEILDTVADADSKWYTPRAWLSKAGTWWKR